MPRSDAFSRCHPAVLLAYFALVLGCTMFFLHPLCLAISLLSALLCCAHFNGPDKLRRTLLFSLPVFGFAILLNPLFNHRGETVLCSLPSGSPVTLESVAYGLASAAMLCAVLVWFSCFNHVMTSDKLLHLFGRAAPSLSLVLTMTLRLIPRFQTQFRALTDAQRALGRNTASNSLRQKLKDAAQVLSAVATWALENGVETADSMRSRGCGLPGRTAFSLYRFDRRDAAVLIWLMFWGGILLAGGLSGALFWQYFPALLGQPLSPLTLSAYPAYLALCLTPIILNRWEERKWNHSRSNI